jgi:20S proteasome alpha/beta subunit
MTIGVGFVCTDGIVLCSDRELTVSDESKFEERKIFSHTLNSLTVLFSYAGYRDSAKVIFTKICDNLPTEMGQAKGASLKEKLRNGLEKIYTNKNVRELQTLIAVSVKHSPPFLFKTSEGKIVDGVAAEYIGTGENSATRYLSSFLIPKFEPLDVRQAGILATYIVHVASRFTKNVGLGANLIILNPDGTTSELMNGIVFADQAEKFLYCEEEIGRVLRDALLR